MAKGSICITLFDCFISEITDTSYEKLNALKHTNVEIKMLESI